MSTTIDAIAVDNGFTLGNRPQRHIQLRKCNFLVKSNWGPQKWLLCHDTINRIYFWNYTELFGRCIDEPTLRPTPHGFITIPSENTYVIVSTIHHITHIHRILFGHLRCDAGHLALWFKNRHYLARCIYQFTTSKSYSCDLSNSYTFVLDISPM